MSWEFRVKGFLSCVPTIAITITVNAIVINVALVHDNGNIHTTHYYNNNGMEHGIVGHHFQSDFVNN